VPRPRFLIIGRDITRDLREREQDQAVQSLLARVFVASDMPVYILDQHGRFLMTNPAFDRLLGTKPGSLGGVAATERYAPHCHEALAAARAQQEVDGREFSIDAVLLGPEGGQIACSVTGVMVRRADLPRLQVMMIRAHQAKPVVRGVTAGGCIQLVGLEEVRHSLGPRWEALKDRAMEAAEHVIKRHLGPGDTLSRTDDQGFVICFAGATEEEASFRSANIGREVRRRLIGEGETAEVAHVFSAEAGAMSTGEIETMVRDRVAQRLRAMQETARARLVEALKTGTCATEMVRARGRDEAVGALLRLPLAAERAFEAAVAVLPGAETASLNTDAMLLGFAHEYAAQSATDSVHHLIFVPLSSDVLLVRKRMEACLDACRAIPERLRQHLVLVIAAPPESSARQLGSGLARLRPFCRSLGVALETLDPVSLDVQGHGVAILLVDAASCQQRGWEAKAKARLSSLQNHRSRLMVRGAPASKIAGLFAGGADLVSIAAEAA
jgi:GGDEF domain-containing protein